MAASNSALEKLFLKARQAIADRDWERAKQMYLQALGLRTDNPDVHYGLATVFFQLRELTSAAHHFKEVTRLDPLRAGAYINLGAVQNLLQEYDDAVASLRRGLQLDPNRVEGYYNLGVVYRHKGQDELALTAYLEALRHNPRMPDAHLNLANLYMSRQNFPSALQHYQEALKIRPDWPKAVDGMEQARGALESTEKKSDPVVVATGKRIDPTHPVDPEVHGSYLTKLHQGVIDSEEVGRNLHQLLEREIEPSLKMLSTCLLYPNRSGMELYECLSKFESALERMRAAQGQLNGRIDYLRKLDGEFPSQ